VQPRVLLARIRALLRRAGPTPEAIANPTADERVFGRFSINQATRVARSARRRSN